MKFICTRSCMAMLFAKFLPPRRLEFHRIMEPSAVGKARGTTRHNKSFLTVGRRYRLSHILPKIA